MHGVFTFSLGDRCGLLSRDKVIPAGLHHRSQVEAWRFARITGRPADLQNEIPGIAGPERLLHAGDERHQLFDDDVIVGQTVLCAHPAEYLAKLLRTQIVELNFALYAPQERLVG